MVASLEKNPLPELATSGADGLCSQGTRRKRVVPRVLSPYEAAHRGQLGGGAAEVTRVAVTTPGLKGIHRPFRIPLDGHLI